MTTSSSPTLDLLCQAFPVPGLVDQHPCAWRSTFIEPCLSTPRLLGAHDLLAHRHVFADARMRPCDTLPEHAECGHSRSAPTHAHPAATVQTCGEDIHALVVLPASPLPRRRLRRLHRLLRRLAPLLSHGTDLLSREHEGDTVNGCPCTSPRACLHGARKRHDSSVVQSEPSNEGAHTAAVEAPELGAFMCSPNDDEDGCISANSRISAQTKREPGLDHAMQQSHVSPDPCPVLTHDNHANIATDTADSDKEPTPPVHMCDTEPGGIQHDMTQERCFALLYLSLHQAWGHYFDLFPATQHSGSYSVHSPAPSCSCAAADGSSPAASSMCRTGALCVWFCTTVSAVVSRARMTVPTCSSSSPGASCSLPHTFATRLCDETVETEMRAGRQGADTISLHCIEDTDTRAEETRHEPFAPTETLSDCVGEADDLAVAALTPRAVDWTCLSSVTEWVSEVLWAAHTTRSSCPLSFGSCRAQALLCHVAFVWWRHVCGRSCAHADAADSCDYGDTHAKDGRCCFCEEVVRCFRMEVSLVVATALVWSHTRAEEERHMRFGRHVCKDAHTMMDRVSLRVCAESARDSLGTDGLCSTRWCDADEKVCGEGSRAAMLSSCRGTLCRSGRECALDGACDSCQRMHQLLLLLLFMQSAGALDDDAAVQACCTNRGV